MNDKGKIIVGLAVFLILMTFPIWKPGKGVPVEREERDNLLPCDDALAPASYQECQQKRECLAGRDEMASSHMKLLDTWRDEVVRFEFADDENVSKRVRALSKRYKRGIERDLATLSSDLYDRRLLLGTGSRAELVDVAVKKYSSPSLSNSCIRWCHSKTDEHGRDICTICHATVGLAPRPASGQRTGAISTWKAAREIDQNSRHPYCWNCHVSPQQEELYLQVYLGTRAGRRQ